MTWEMYLLGRGDAIITIIIDLMILIIVIIGGFNHSETPEINEITRPNSGFTEALS